MDRAMVDLYDLSPHQLFFMGRDALRDHTNQEYLPPPRLQIALLFLDSSTYGVNH